MGPAREIVDTLKKTSTDMTRTNRVRVLPDGVTGLEPTEESWKPLKQTLGSRYFRSPDKIRSAI